MADVFTDNSYHINIEINKEELDKGFRSLSKELLKSAKTIKKLGGNVSEFTKEAERFRGRRRNLDRTLENELNNIADDIIDSVLDRYFSYQKKDGKPVHVGNLSDALSDKETNMEITTDDKFIRLGIMNRDFLKEQTETERKPYYIYQNLLNDRFFILRMHDSAEEIHAEDREMILDRIKKTIDKIMSSERF